MSGLPARSDSEFSPGADNARLGEAREQAPELPDPANHEQLAESTLAKLFDLGGEKLVGQLVQLFADATPARIETIRMADADAEEAERAAHTLKSSTGNLGAMRMWAQCQVLESMAASGDFGDAYAATVEELQQEYSIVEPRLRAFLESKR